MPMDADDGPISLGDPKGLAPVEPERMNKKSAKKYMSTAQRKRTGAKTAEMGVKIAIAIALADGPLPIGDTIAAVGLIAIGGYLLLTE